MTTEPEPKKIVDWSTVGKWIDNNWAFQEGSVVYNPDHIDEMAVGLVGDIDDFVRSIVRPKVNNLIEELNQMKRIDLADWVFNKNDIVDDKIKQIFGDLM